MLTQLLTFFGLNSKRGAHVHRVSNVQFLSEQDGPLERKLKTRWAPVLSQFGVTRAYLVKVQIFGQPEPSVALAMSKTPFPERDVVDALVPLFKEVMASTVYVDMLFLSPEQEAKAASVCKNFLQAV